MEQAVPQAAQLAKTLSGLVLFCYLLLVPVLTNTKNFLNAAIIFITLSGVNVMNTVIACSFEVK